MKIKVSGIIELGEEWNFTDKVEEDWFESVLKDKDQTILMLWSNEVGDEIGHTNEIKIQILKQ